MLALGIEVTPTYLASNKLALTYWKLNNWYHENTISDFGAVITDYA